MWAVIDVITTQRIIIRNLDKLLWLLVVLFVPTIGAVAWIAFGRPSRSELTPGSKGTRPTGPVRNAAPRGLEDSDAWSTTTRPSKPADRSRDVDDPDEAE